MYYMFFFPFLRKADKTIDKPDIKPDPDQSAIKPDEELNICTPGQGPSADIKT